MKQTGHDACNSLDSNINKFHQDQAYIFNSIWNEILLGITVADRNAPMTKPFLHKCGWIRACFLESPGRTGKTFTIRIMKSILKLGGKKLIAVAVFNVAASLLNRGKTTRSIFKIRIHCFSEIFCKISINSKQISNNGQTNFVIWDDIVMCERYCVEAADRTLRAIVKSSNVPFSGRFIYSVAISENSDCLTRWIEISDCIYDTGIFFYFFIYTCVNKWKICD